MFYIKPALCDHMVLLFLVNWLWPYQFHIEVRNYAENNRKTILSTPYGMWQLARDALTWEYGFKGCPNHTLKLLKAVGSWFKLSFALVAPHEGSSCSFTFLFCGVGFWRPYWPFRDLRTYTGFTCFLSYAVGVIWSSYILLVFTFGSHY